MGMLLLEGQEKAIEFAEEIVRNFDINDIAYCCQEMMDNVEYEGLHTAVDLDYPKKKQKADELYNKVKAELSPEGKQALVAYVNLRADETVARTTAWFYLGFAAAKKILSWGKGSRKKGANQGSRKN